VIKKKKTICTTK